MVTKMISCVKADRGESEAMDSERNGPSRGFSSWKSGSGTGNRVQIFMTNQYRTVRWAEGYLRRIH